MGAAPTPLYIARSKTVWRHFYPQEEQNNDEERIRESAAQIMDIIKSKE